MSYCQGMSLYCPFFCGRMLFRLLTRTSVANYFRTKKCRVEVAQCLNYGNLVNLLSHFFGKNFVKVTWLLKNLLELVSRIFFWVRVIFTFFHNMQSNKNCWISIILKKIIGLWRAMKMCSILQFHKKSWSRYSTIWKLCTYICMYVKVTFLLKKLLKNWFDKNSFR